MPDTKKLIQQCKANDYHAQLAVFDAYKDLLFSAAVRIVKRPSLAEDVVQEAFIKGFQRIADLDDDSNLGAWLYRIASNTAIDALRKEKRFDWQKEETTVYLSDDSAIDSEENELPLAELQQALDELKEHYRLVVVLYAIEGYSHKEIAQRLELKESTVRNQYRRAKIALKKAIEKKLRTCP